MSRYDGLIIPRSYSEYINKTDAATLLQALQQSGVMDVAPTSNSNHPVKSGGVYQAILKSTSIEDMYGTYGDTYNLNDFVSNEFRIRVGRVFNNTTSYSDYNYPAREWTILIWLPITSASSYGCQIALATTARRNFIRYISSDSWSAWTEL